jgi:hypothetical protein
MAKPMQITKETLISVLKKHDDNGARSAEELGVSRAHVSFLRKKYNIPRAKGLRKQVNFRAKVISLNAKGCAPPCIAIILKKPETEIIKILKEDLKNEQN